MDSYQPRYTRSGVSHARDDAQAVTEIAEAIHQPHLAGVVFFCSPQRDLPRLSEALNARFDCPVVGCTTAGEICGGYHNASLVAISFAHSVFRLHPCPLPRLEEVDENFCWDLARSLQQRLELNDRLHPNGMFGVLLIDGLSLHEEQITARLAHAMPEVPFLGGSAGDDLCFEQTQVFFDGAFHGNAAVFLLVETSLPFEVFRLQHFVPQDRDMVLTATDPARRIVHEIDGEPAAEAYARFVGLGVDELTPQVFSAHPVMLQVGEEWYVRSIKKVNEDGSLTFLCAIDTGLPLNLALATGFIETLEAKVAELRDRFPRIETTLGFDCVLRRLEMLESGHKSATEALLNQLNFNGFSTYGEQFNALHVNQTLTGVVIGGR